LQKFLNNIRNKMFETTTTTADLATTGVATDLAKCGTCSNYKNDVCRRTDCFYYSNCDGAKCENNAECVV
jgi:hypothetical protein